MLTTMDICVSETGFPLIKSKRNAQIFRAQHLFR